MIEAMVRKRKYNARFAGDTCIALEQYQQDPGKSSLSTVLPCNDLRSAQPALRDARDQMHDLINQVRNYQCNFTNQVFSKPPSSARIKSRFCSDTQNN